jgi:hypothetical protein
MICTYMIVCNPFYNRLVFIGLANARNFSSYNYLQFFEKFGPSLRCKDHTFFQINDLLQDVMFFFVYNRSTQGFHLNSNLNCISMRYLKSTHLIHLKTYH